jgi:hypothetical protein
MDRVEWLDAVMALVQERSVEGEVSRPDDDTLAITLGRRGVVLHVVGNDAFLVRSVAAGSTIESRLRDRVEHFRPEKFAIDRATTTIAADAILTHVREV